MKLCIRFWKFVAKVTGWAWLSKELKEANSEQNVYELWSDDKD